MTARISGRATRRPARITLVALAAVALSVGTLAPAASAARDSSTDGSDRVPIQKLRGVVGPAYTISLNRSTVPAGTYKFIVHDKGTSHNFHIKGPGGISEETTVPGTGRTEWTLQLIEGRYRIQCDPHDSSMHVWLDVT